MEKAFSFRLTGAIFLNEILYMWIIEYFFVTVAVSFFIQISFEVSYALYGTFRSNDIKRLGDNSWALITGSTDGVGQGFAIVLAKKGFNIVQVSRNPDKLERCADDLRAKYGIQVKNIVKDFSKCTQDPIGFFNDIYTQTKGLDVSIIINNVGTSYSFTGYTDLKVKKIEEILALNIFPITFLMRLYLPQMALRRSENGIINLSSVLGNVKYEKYSLYCASKAFVKSLSEVVASECGISRESKGVSVMCLQPGYVLTPLTANTKGKFLVLDREICAENALRVLGNSDCTSGHWKHLIAAYIYKSVSCSMFMKIKKLNS